MTPLPPGPFGAILVDFPWAFKTFSGDDVVPTLGEQPYETMSLEDGALMPVQDVAAPDCLLFMWTVSYLQDEATELARAWGFDPVSLAFIWDKESIGMGYYVRQEAEVCKLYKRGSPKVLDHGVPQMIREPRRAHSQKPAEQYWRIERLVAGPYLELFSRSKRPGWVSWGNQAGIMDLSAMDRPAKPQPPLLGIFETIDADAS